MKRLLLKSTLLLCALVIGSMNVWAAADEKITFSDQGYSNQQAIEEVNGSNFKITFDKGTNSNAPKYYTSGTAIRAYGGNTMTVASTSKKFVKIEITFGSSDGSNAITTDVETYSDGTWTGSANSVVFTIGGTSGNRRISSVAVTYESTDATKVSTPVISGDESFLNSTEVSITCGTEDSAIKYSTDDGATWNDYNDPFTIIATTTVKAKATKSGLTDSDEASKTFTKVTPMTVAEAIAAIDAGTGTTDVYVRGIVCDGGSSLLSSGAMNYWISDDGTESNKFEVYKGKGLNGASFNSTDDVKVGDIVVVFGDIKKFSDTYEFDSGSKIISHIKKVATPTFSPTAGAVAAGATVTISTTTDGATIYYTTDGTAPTTSSPVYSLPITIDAAKTINAFAVKDGCPNSDVASASYTIAEPAATPTFSLAEGIYTEVKTVTISTATDGATIYYTTDGSEPTTESTEYTSAITVDETMTIKAIAAKDGMANSAVASVTYTINLPDYVTLPFSFDSGKSSLPAGLTQSGLGSDYSSAPYLKFDHTGDYLIMKTNEPIGTLTFDIKGNSFSGGTFTVQYSVDGSSYSDLASYTTLGDTQEEIFNNVPDNARYIKWIYTSKSSGNVGLGGINVQKYVSITPAKTYTTLTSAKALDFTSVSADLKAYIIKDTDASDGITLTQVNKVPAGTGMVLEATTPGTAVNVPVLTGAPDDVEGNKMTGSATATTAIAANGGYILSDGKFHPALAGDLPAGKAYLNIPVTISSPEMIFGETTAIENLTPDLSLGERVQSVYNLSGQRVAQPTKGLYIVNGRKVVMK